MTDGPVDDTAAEQDPFDEILAEIEQEARTRRSSGAYPADLLRTLDEEFHRWIPPDSDDNGVESAIRQVEVAAFIDAAVPVASNQRAGRYVKTAVRKATGFYHHWMAQQVTTLALHLTKPMRLIDTQLRSLNERVSAVERATDIGVADRQDVLDRLALPGVPTDLRDALVERLAGIEGRIVHTDARTTSLVAALDSAGGDVYGIATAEVDHELIRTDDPVSHLRWLDQDVLGAIVLSGVTDRYGLNGQLELLELAATRVKRGGAVVVVGTSPTVWNQHLGPVAADLLSGRPLHPATWRHLMQHRSMSDIVQIDSDDGTQFAITAVVR